MTSHFNVDDAVEYGNPSGENFYGWSTEITGTEWAEALWTDGRLSYNNRTVSGVDILGEGGMTVLT